MNPEDPLPGAPEPRTPRCVKIKLNPLFTGVSGSLGGLNLFTKDGQTFARPKMKRTWPLTAKERAYRKRFEKAVIYARKVLADPKKKAFYEAAARSREARTFALVVQD